MATAKVIESTPAGSDGGGVRTTTRNIDAFVAYRHISPAVAVKIAHAAQVFLQHKSNYKYSRSGNPFKGKKVTESTIATTSGYLCCTALCAAATEAAQGKNQKLEYNKVPDNFKRMGMAKSVTLQTGDILCRQPQGASTGGHWMVYVGGGSVAGDIVPELVMRKRFPEYENKFYYTNVLNPFVGGAGIGPTSTYHNCTWYAFGRFCEIAGQRCNLPTGAAGTWYVTYSGKKGKIPKLGAVVEFSHHVAIVERIFDNGDILTSNSAWNGGSDNGKGKGGSYGGQPKEYPEKKNYYTHAHSDIMSDEFSFPYFYTHRLTAKSGWSDAGGGGKPIGFLYQDNEFDTVSEESWGEGYVALDLHQTSTRLKSSMNYEYIYGYDEEPDLLKRKAKGDTSLFEYDIKGINEYSKMREYMLEFDAEGLETKGAKIADDDYSNLVYDFNDASSADAKVKDSRVIVYPGAFGITEALVQVPFVELDFGNGNVIGSYLSNNDRFPNHIKSMRVEKVNGEINKYTFNLVHQIRAGEDPNLLDKVLSTTRYDYVKLRYGDSGDRRFITDNNLVITDIVMNRDYAAARIDYTIYATSAGTYLTSVKMDFPAVFDKPSNQILKLLYDDPIASPILQETFPGMANKTEVMSKGFIPSAGNAIKIEAQTNISIWERIASLTSLMAMSIRGIGDLMGVSFATAGIAAGEILGDVAEDLLGKAGEVIGGKYGTEAAAIAGAAIGTAIAPGAGTLIGAGAGALVGKLFGKKIGGWLGGEVAELLKPTFNAVGTVLGMIIGLGTAAAANFIADALDKVSNLVTTYFLVEEDDYFYIKAVRQTTSNRAVLSTLTNILYEVTVGYPGDECVMDFKVNQDTSWAPLLEKGLVSDEYVYAINRDGETIKKVSPNLFSSTDAMTSVEQAWWEFALTFPITATLKIKGLLRPTKLMDYVIVNVSMYGMQHLTSGLYIITAEQEILSENGFVTELTLLRVDNERK